MKKIISNFLLITLAAVAFNFAHGPNEIQIDVEKNIFGQKPIPVALDGFTGEGLEV